VARINRREFVGMAGAATLASAEAGPASLADMIAIPDNGWHLWLDRAAPWRDDAIFLPEDANLATLPVNPPTGGWGALSGTGVTLPATVEQHFWGAFGSRPYTDSEFTYADTDTAPQNGAYEGVSWWWREIDIPAALKGRRLILNLRGARQRAEVYLNRKLVGYSIIEQLPFDCDLTDAAVAGGPNLLAIRITNPGGRFDWVDGDTTQWGKVKIQRGHGFGGLDRGLTISAHPLDARITDAWVLNTPKAGTVHAFVSVTGIPGFKNIERQIALRITDTKSGKQLPVHVIAVEHKSEAAATTFEFEVCAKNPAVWDLATPQLYSLDAALKTKSGVSHQRVTFGFRWFTSDGVGKNAVFKLNGRRIKLYSAISWGYWGGNGMWPTPDLAEKEVRQAKVLGLNCLAFHRNPGKHDVLDAQDRLGLLRAMEPGGGKFAFGRIPDSTKTDQHSVVMLPPETAADKFCQRYMMAKIRAMMRAFRSHPSLIHWTLQNENNADFSDPNTLAVLEAMRAEDESRIILMNDGMSSPEFHAAQAWYEPYNPVLHRSDKEPWGGWWDDHQGAGDQWYDRFYQDPEHFTYRNTLAAPIVQYGEMEGCAVPDNHTLMVAEILARGGKAYDLKDHQEILAAYQAFLKRWNFTGAFPSAEALFLSLGHKAYASWQNYMENVRIADAVDYAAISGWETTAIDNHSGIVDNFRNFKSDPKLIAGSLLPVRPVAKQRTLTIARGEAAVFDLYLLDDTGKAVADTLTFTMTTPSGRKSVLATLSTPKMDPGEMRALVREGFMTPALAEEGLHHFEFALTNAPSVTQVRDLWVVDARRAPVPGKILKVGVAGVWPRLRDQLQQIPGITVADYAAGGTFDVVIASGLTDTSTPGQKIGGDDGLTLDKKSAIAPVPGALPVELIAAAKNGLPLLLLPQEDGLADGVAHQLAAAGAFTYDGQVGRYRAPWMGNWYFVRKHPVYAGCPVNRAMDGFFQARGRLANGLIVDGPNVEVFAGYSRDHDRRIGAGTFTARLGSGKLLFHRVPDFAAPMQLRFLSNALQWLCA
jgi:beta-galactosidase